MNKPASGYAQNKKFRGESPFSFGAIGRIPDVATSIANVPHIERFDEGVPVEYASGEHFLFMLPIGGSIELSDPPHRLETLAKDTILFVPSFCQVLVAPTHPGTQLLVVEFSPSITLCHGICPRGHDSPKSCSERATRGETPEQHSLTTRIALLPSLKLWRDTVVEYCNSGVEALDLYEFKLRELFFNLRNGYGQTELDDFLRSYHCTNLGFRSFIYKHHLESRNVEHLASKLGMSISMFKRTFRDEFHMPPLQWMNKQKAKYLARDLIETDLSMTELAERYHFATVSYLCAFCRKYFNARPNELRRMPHSYLLMTHSSEEEETS